MRVDGDLDELPPGSQAEAEFKLAFAHDIARATGVHLDRVQIEELRAGSVVVDFAILPSLDDTGPTVGSALTTLNEHFNRLSSPLYDGKITSRIIREDGDRLEYSFREAASNIRAVIVQNRIIRNRVHELK